MAGDEIKPTRVKEYLESLTPEAMGAYVRAASQAMSPAPTDPAKWSGWLALVGEMAKNLAMLSPELVEQITKSAVEIRLTGILIAVEDRTLRDGSKDPKKKVLRFLPTSGKYAGMYDNPDDRATAQGRPAYEHDGGGRFRPFEETCTTEWVDDPAEAAKVEVARSMIGKHVAYTIWRDTEAEGAPKGGFRMFGRIIGEVPLHDDPKNPGSADRVRAIARRHYNIVLDGTEPEPAGNETPTVAPPAEPVQEPVEKFNTSMDFLTRVTSEYGMTVDDVKAWATHISGKGRSPEDLSKMWAELVKTQNYLLKQSGTTSKNAATLIAAHTEMSRNTSR